mgnify:FL=1
MHCNAEPGKDESGVAAASGRGIYESVRTDHHERWDREGLVHSLDLLEQLAGKVPVYHLACDISEDAVKTLEQEIGTGSFESETYAAALHKNMIRKREKHA